MVQTRSILDNRGMSESTFTARRAPLALGTDAQTGELLVSSRRGNASPLESKLKQLRIMPIARAGLIVRFRLVIRL
jgi:hypothetical protein